MADTRPFDPALFGGSAFTPCQQRLFYRRKIVLAGTLGSPTRPYHHRPIG